MNPMFLMAGGQLMASLFGMSEQSKQAKRQNKLAEKQQELSEQDYYNRLQQQQEWKEKYGGIEHNMLKYVQSLDANSIYGLQEGGLRQSYERARQNMDAHLAERGFDVASGVHADQFQQLADQEAQQEVHLKQLSQQYVTQQQQSLLTGNPMPQVSTAGMQNALNNQMTIGQQNFKNQQDAYGDFSKSIGRAMKAYKDYNKPDDPSNKIITQTTTANTGRG